MPLPKSWTTVTPLSKTIALILFAFLPAIAFFFGVRYQQRLDQPLLQTQPTTIVIEKSVPPTPTPIYGWRIYKNTKYNYQIEYPANLIVYGDNRNSIDKSPYASFDPIQRYFGIPTYSVRVVGNTDSSSNKYGLDSPLVLAKIFQLKVGEQTDQQTTYDIGGKWNFNTRYKRLPDEVVNGQTFFVIENPEWYGGANRILLLQKSKYTYILEKTYNSTNELQQFKTFYRTFILS